MTLPIPKAYIHGCCTQKCQGKKNCVNCFCQGCFRANCARNSMTIEHVPNAISGRTIWFHGTNYKNAVKIIKTGFKESTWFAKHLEDALIFGGRYVFEVNISFRSRKWQVCCSHPIHKDKIRSLFRYTKDQITQSCPHQ